MSIDGYGEIITFYSYKGGTGRTMALCNVACLLARRIQSQRKEVLMIDWDLEAPGLHKFFFQSKYLTPSEREEKKAQLGLIDLFSNLEWIITNSEFKQDEEIANDALNRVDISSFVVGTHISNLKMINAGLFNDEYPSKVTSFNWVRLYERSPSLIRLFAERLAERYRYVLIDSRTGYSDSGGICTMLMPQKLVVVFTPNSQSFDGTVELTKTATKYRRRSPDLRLLLVYPLASRIEASLGDLRAYWRFGNKSQGFVGYEQMFEDLFKDVYGLTDCNLKEYFEEVQI